MRVFYRKYEHDGLKRMTIAEYRKELRAIGFKLKLKNHSYGYHAQYLYLDTGKPVPSIMDADTAEALLPLHNLRDSVDKDCFKYRNDPVYGI